MLRIRFAASVGSIALALCAAQPALAQGLSNKLDEAEKKLDADIKACRPIDPKEYKDLTLESSRNVSNASNILKSGVPVDTQQVLADAKRARALLDRATAAAAKPCPPPQQAPQNAGPPPTQPITPGGLRRIFF